MIFGKDQTEVEFEQKIKAIERQIPNRTHRLRQAHARPHPKSVRIDGGQSGLTYVGPIWMGRKR